MITKICTKCLVEKNIDIFSNNKSRKDGKSSQCKECENINKKTYYEQKKSEILTKRKLERKNNPDKFREKDIQYYKNNKDTIRVKNSVRCKKWQAENKLHLREYQNSYQKNRRSNDPLYKLKVYIRNAIYHSLIRYGYTKKSKTFEILGCTYEEFKTHIESQWETWMTWDNYGLYNGNYSYGWDIDHILPVSSGKTEDDIIKLNHYTNLKPLCSKINRDEKRNIY